MISRFWRIISTPLTFLSHRFSRAQYIVDPAGGTAGNHGTAFVSAPKPLIFVAFAVYFILNDQKECP